MQDNPYPAPQPGAQPGTQPGGYAQQPAPPQPMPPQQPYGYGAGGAGQYGYYQQQPQPGGYGAPPAPGPQSGPAKKPAGKTTVVILAVALVVVFAAAVVCGVLLMLEKRGESPQEILSLGDRYLSQGEYELALLSFLRVIEIDPENASAYIGAVKVYQAQGLLDAAADMASKGQKATGSGVLADLLHSIEEEMLAQQPLPEAPVADVPPPASDSGDAPASSEPAAPNADIGLAIGNMAPDFELAMRGGGMVRLWDLRGKPVFLNFCTTWCPPCQGEFAEVQAIYEMYGDAIYVLGVSAGETMEEVDAYFDQYPYNYPLAYDPANIMYDLYGIEFIPQSFFLDENGIIKGYIPGAVTQEEFAEIIDTLL